MNYAIDENVIAVANDFNRVSRGEAPLCPQAGDICRLACIEFLSSALDNDIVLLDAGDLVFSYYRRKASMAGQLGTGDAFLKHLYQVCYDSRKVKRIELDQSHGFGLPDDFVDCGFDLDDMIYIALAKSSPPAMVVNAVDSDYDEYSEEISAIDVEVRELCE